MLTTWNPYKVVAIGMTVVILFQRINRQLPTDIKRLLCYFIFLLLAGNTVALFMPETSAGTRGIIRLFVQNITYLLGFVPIIYMKWLPKDFAKRALKWYTFAICTLIGIGFIHYAFLKAGIPFSPIIRDVGTTNQVAATHFGDNIVYRIYGFCGEPKNLAFALVPLILYYIARLLINRSLDKGSTIILVCALFILINTYSSAAYIELVIGGVVVMCISVGQWKKNTIGLVISFFLLFGCVTYAYILVTDVTITNAQNDKKDFIDNFYERSFGRAQNELNKGRTETIIMDDYIQSNNIIYYLFGYGPGQYSFHSKGLIFDQGYIPVQSGLVLNIIDFGICGYIFFLYLLWFIYVQYLKARHIEDKLSLYFIIIGGVVLVGNMMYSMMGGSILVGMLPFIGIAYWINHNNHNGYCHD